MASTNGQPKNRAEVEDYIPPPLTAEEEDALIHLRILSDERALRKVIKKFHTYVFASEPGGVAYGTDDKEISLDEAREGLLAELATFQGALQKSSLVCQAETRQVVEYEKEKERIAKEHDVAREEIAKLKVSLEEAQLLRKRKIEYDQVAEKVNLLPSRAELQASIISIREEIAAIQIEQEHKAMMMYARKTALDQIVSSLETLRQMDKEPEVQVVMDETPDANTGEGAGEEEGRQREDRDDDRRDREREREARDRDDDGDEAEETQVADAMLNPSAKPFLPRGTLDRLRDGGHTTPASTAPPSNASSPTPHKPEEGEEGEEREDIEMGEVSEAISQAQHLANGRLKKREKEELEEGEASDGSSGLAGAQEN
ncbi:hypothetical protein K439DRAFT_392254 [Ramaria rubella]|nr:hypothetical protein K439DRAFT_392254 [Ramaria rubella]